MHRFSRFAFLSIAVATATVPADDRTVFAAGNKGSGPANALISAPSPYLRQHAYDEVNWLPWGENALQRAKRDNKPIFLSIGYSTCHWCHVMQRESFQNDNVAAVINEHFVAVKVDRELRPDLDDMYMQATLIATGAGGWPNNVFLTPDGKPFFGMTYAPPDQFEDFLRQIAALWRTEEAGLRADGGRIAEAIETHLNRKTAAMTVDAAALSTAIDTIVEQSDSFNGGIGTAPKFPRETMLQFLLEEAARSGNDKALSTAQLTLDAILAGGIRDHVGGGFHRYAIDNAWLVPHFEKMLTTQALLTDNLVLAWRLTGKSAYRRAAEDTLDYVLRRMQAPGGGFYAAEDADSEGVEGKFYLWSLDELRAVLGNDDATVAQAVYGVTADGNFEGYSILHHPDSLNAVAGALGLEPAVLDRRIDTIKNRLRDVRDKRVRPHRDDKIIVAWNGLMIAALARAGWSFQRTDYIDAAARAAKRFVNKLSDQEQLPRAVFKDRITLNGGLDDYAALGLGLVALYDVTGDRTWIEHAGRLVDAISERFEDPASGDYFMTANASGIGRIKQSSDSGTPSASALTLAFFAAMQRRRLDPDLPRRAIALAGALSARAVEHPLDSAAALTAIARLQFGDGEPIASFGRGAVRAVAAFDPAAGRVGLLLDLASGWHVNSDRPLDEDVVATEVALLADGKRIDATISYPAPIVRKLGFADTPLALFEDTARITVTPKSSVDAGAVLSLKVTVQPCSDEICLEPETATLVLGRR